jgi:hypothetical protein
MNHCFAFSARLDKLAGSENDSALSTVNMASAGEGIRPARFRRQAM